MLPRWTAALALSALLGCGAAVESGLSEQEANELVFALDSAGIAARKEREPNGGNAPLWAVRVASEDVPPALAVMRAEELPRRAPAGLDAMFETTRLVPSPGEERARLSAGIAGELARTLESIDGVVDARVHLGFPIDSSFTLDDEAEPLRASVLLRYHGASPPFDAAELKALVAGSVSGLDAQNVTLVALPKAAAPRIDSPIVHIGPLAVARSSATPLRAILGTSLAVNIGLAVALALLMARLRSRRRDSMDPLPPPGIERKTNP